MADTEKQNSEELSHTEAMEIFRETMADIIMADPLLVDLPPEPTLEEINSQIALEHGRAILINVRQLDERGTVLRKLLISVTTNGWKVWSLIKQMVCSNSAKQSNF